MRYVDFVHGVNPEDVDFLVGLEVEDRTRVRADVLELIIILAGTVPRAG